MLPALPQHWTEDTWSHMLQSRTSRMLPAVRQHWTEDTWSHMLQSRTSRMLPAVPQHWTEDTWSHMLYSVVNSLSFTNFLSSQLPVIIASSFQLYRFARRGPSSLKA